MSIGASIGTGEAATTSGAGAGSGIEAARPVPVGHAGGPFRTVSGLDAAVLGTIAVPEVGLVLWTRALAPPLAEAAAGVLRLEPFEETGAGSPEEAVEDVLAALPPGCAALRDDVLALAALFRAEAGCERVRIRVEHAVEQICPRFHVDAVRLRLLCTYAGPGTEWLDGRGSTRRMPAGHVGLMKGTRWPGSGTAAVRHRSPDVSVLPAARRGRLLLVIDEEARPGSR